MLLISKCEIDKAVKVIKDGGLACFPTETVFGLGCIASKESSFLRIVEVKKRPANKPFTLMCSSIEQALDYIEYNEKIVSLMKKYFPGQLTIITKCKKGIQKHIDLGTNYIGIRIPDDEFVLNLISRVNEPMLVTSANISSFPPALNDKEANDYFKDGIDIIIKGECKSNIPSTIVMFKDGKLTLIREGIIKFKELEDYINGKKEY